MEVTLKPGMVLGGSYRLVSVIGRGGMGEVWRARHERLPKDVAVKVLLHVAVSGDTANARFRREAEIASRLAHPNIVDVIDFNVLPEGVPYMVLEMLEGQSLRGRLEQGRVPLDETARLVRQISSALAAAHAQGVVHRDLKPENIFLVEEPGETGPTTRAKVLDFGISKIIGDTALTMDREVLGTPFYMAPEQAAGRRDQVDGRADQFALACIAYEMLSGKMAFYGGSVLEVLGAILNGTPTPIEQLVSGVPESVVQAIDKALSKSPDDRFAHILEFSEAFCRFLGPQRKSAASLGAVQSEPNPGQVSRSQGAPAAEPARELVSAPTEMLPGTGNHPAEPTGPEGLATDPLAGTMASQDLVNSATIAADSQSIEAASTGGTRHGPPLAPVPAPMQGAGTQPESPRKAFQEGTGGKQGAPATPPGARTPWAWYLGGAALLISAAALALVLFRPSNKAPNRPQGTSSVALVHRDAGLPPKDASHKVVTPDASAASPAHPSGDAGTPGPNNSRARGRAPGRTQPGKPVQVTARHDARMRASRTRGRPRGEGASTAHSRPSSVDPAIQAACKDSLAKARHAVNSGNFRDAWVLARRAKDLCKSQAAWKTFVMASCGWRRFTAAKSGYKHIRSKRMKKSLIGYCRRKGILLTHD